MEPLRFGISPRPSCSPIAGAEASTQLGYLYPDKSRYDTPKGPRFALTCKPEASEQELESLRTFVPGFSFGRAGDVWDLLHHGVTYQARNAKDVLDYADAVKGRRAS